MKKPEPAPLSTRQKITGTIMLVVLAGIIYSLLPDREPGSATDYRPNWSTDFHPTITKALVYKGATECGEYRWKERIGQREWLVQCVRGDTVLNTYQVFAARDINGPL